MIALYELKIILNTNSIVLVKNVNEFVSGRRFFFIQCGTDFTGFNREDIAEVYSRRKDKGDEWVLVKLKDPTRKKKSQEAA